MEGPFRPSLTGSSPREWGKRAVEVADNDSLRVIPTRVGKA